MRRDPQIFGMIVLALDEAVAGGPPVGLSFPGYTADAVSFYVRLLAVHGWLDAEDHSTVESLDVRPTGLTIAGREFAEAIRNPRVWEEVARRLRDDVGSVTLEAVREIAWDARGLHAFPGSH